MQRLQAQGVMYTESTIRCELSRVLSLKVGEC
jgi:hypothetical protein